MKERWPLLETGLKLTFISHLRKCDISSMFIRCLDKVSIMYISVVYFHIHHSVKNAFSSLIQIMSLFTNYFLVDSTSPALPLLVVF